MLYRLWHRLRSMASVESTMVPLGTPLPSFALPGLDGATVSSADFTGRPVLVAFLCNHCPYVRHVEAGFGELVAETRGLAVVGICSNDPGAYPDDDVPGLRDQAARAGWTFPYLVDQTQAVGREFGAACTPDFFLYNADGRLAYRGAMDGARPGNGVPVTGELLRDAIAKVRAGEAVPEPHRPSMGCSIKWRD
jgi:peroxiredoxin